MKQLPPNVPTSVLIGHAMPIPWRICALRLGLIDALEEGPVLQRQRDHRSLTKLIESLAAVL